MCKQGDEPDPDDWLLWVITAPAFWKADIGNVSTNNYKKPKFSAFLERMQDTEATLRYACRKWGSDTYGIARFRYSDVVAAGYHAVIEEEDGNAAHVNVFTDPRQNLSKKVRSNRLRDHTEIVRPWGVPAPGE